MKKTKMFEGVLFPPDVLQKALEKLKSLLGDSDSLRFDDLRVSVESEEEWAYDSQAEFFAGYRAKPVPRLAVFYIWGTEHGLSVRFSRPRYATEVEVRAPERATIEDVFEVFETDVDRCVLPPIDHGGKAQNPRIFIGHGRSEQWRDLKDHLHEKHGYDVEAYEIGARAGHAIRDILEDMLAKSSFAILVMTGEDKDASGQLRARENVVHELGLFQGHLGFSRAIILLEAGTSEFSNIHGINQIRYGQGNIKETYGEVLATLRREFKT